MPDDKNEVTCPAQSTLAVIEKTGWYARVYD